MSYKTISLSAKDAPLGARIAGAIAQEQKVRGEPVQPYFIHSEMTWAVCTASDVEAAYAYALETNNPDPGGDETVITDGMILANVQANWPDAPA